jgi:hypothetical protein
MFEFCLCNLSRAAQLGKRRTKRRVGVALRMVQAGATTSLVAATGARIRLRLNAVEKNV